MRLPWGRVLPIPLRLSGLLLALLAGASAPGAVRGAELAPVDDFPDVLNQYRRIELVVPAAFEADCQRKGDVINCRLSTIPDNFIRPLRALRGGAISQVDIRGRRGKSFEVGLTLAGPGLDFRSAVLPSPARWVVEVGLPLTMSDPVEEEVPFRPYPVAPTPFEPILPKSPVVAPTERGAAADAVRACVSAALGNEAMEALSLCAEAAHGAHAQPDLKRQALMARGEAAAKVAKSGHAPDLSTITEAIGAAEDAAPDAEAKGRFALLQAQSYLPMGFPARGEAHLDEKIVAYKGTAAEPWLMAGQLAGEIVAKNPENVTAIIKRLQVMPGNNPNVGGTVLLAAGQTYERGDYVKSLELFDNAWRRWPEQLTGNPAALFQYAELCNTFGRTEEARTYYTRYLELYPRKKPHHIVRVRLADFAVADDPLAARAKLADLAVALREAEGQQMAALHVLKLTSDAKERRRTLRQVQAAGPSDYLRPELQVELARSALASGRLRESYELLRDIWRGFPNEPMLTRAPRLFDRVLYLMTQNPVALDRPLAAIIKYYGERKRFEKHELREEMHLLAGQAFNRLGMSEEAFTVFQRGLRQGNEPVSPTVEPQVYLEMASALVKMKDRFRLHEILRYLDKKYPGRFDTYAYWHAKGADAQWANHLSEARDIYVYALNGPVTHEQRIELAGDVAEVYAEMGDTAKAVRALKTRIELHDASGLPKESPVRRAAAWRVAEVAYDGESWASAIEWLGRFLNDYPTDPNRTEALFLKAQALQRMGDAYSALKIYDGLVTETQGGPFRTLAQSELDMLKWQRRIAPEVAAEAGFPVAPNP